jgi:uncharacterized protein
MQRRSFLVGLSAMCLAPGLRALVASDSGRRLAQAARAQVGVTLGYDPRYTHVSYPGGDVPRSTGVCADVIVRAARDAFGLDLQKLVHEDMHRAFDAYPARRTWGSREPDTNIDHHRVLNLETYWHRAGTQIWFANGLSDGSPRTATNCMFGSTCVFGSTSGGLRRLIRGVARLTTCTKVPVHLHPRCAKLIFRTGFG